MRWPLRRQILLPMVGILLLTVGVVSALNAWLAGSRVRRQLERQLADVSATLSSSNFPLESNVLSQMRGLTGADYVVVDAHGQATGASDEALLPAAEKNGLAAAALDLSAAVEIDGRRMFHVAVPLERPASQPGRLALHVFYSEAAWREARWQAMWPPLVIGFISVAVIGVVVTLVARNVTHPIADLRSHVDRIAQGQFSQMPIPARDDEIKDLAAAVNQMARQLAQYEDQVRTSERLRAIGTLGGGIAHQIRNAATGCRIALDLHQRDCQPSPGKGQSQEPLQVAVKQLSQIEMSVQRLLTLGKPSVPTRTSADVVAIIKNATALVRPMASHLRIDLVEEYPAQSPTLQADAHALTQMIVNLLMNAVEAAAQSRDDEHRKPAMPTPSVQTRLKAAPDRRYHLAVGNTGAGPPPAVQPRLFEPFATDKPGGTGLGLAVARRIAEDHGGSIHWEQQDHTTWFIVTLPASG